MLTLTRRIGETVILDLRNHEGYEDLSEEESIVKVCILDIKGNQVKLGLAADRRIGIWREELLSREKK